MKYVNHNFQYVKTLCAVQEGSYTYDLVHSGLANALERLLCTLRSAYQFFLVFFNFLTAEYRLESASNLGDTIP